MDRLAVAKASALGDLHGIDIANEVADRRIRRCQLLSETLAAVSPRDGQVAAQLCGEAAAPRADRLRGSSLISQPSTTGIHSSSRLVSERMRRVLPCPRSPRSTMSCPASSARSSCGPTVSSKPTMPGKVGCPDFSRRMTLARISSLTVRASYPSASRTQGSSGTARARAVRGRSRTDRTSNPCKARGRARVANQEYG